MRNSKGSILFYVLTFFVYFMIFFESVVSIKIKQSHLKDAVEKIELRLRIEKEVIGFYRENMGFSLDDEGEGLLGATLKYDFDFENIEIHTEKIDEKIRVNMIGAITHTFYYVIMEDGSFTMITVEENYDNIK